MQDQYLELTSWVDSKATLFGAGERSSETLHLARNGLPLTLWGHDLGPTFLLQNMYGAHPFVLAVEEGESAVVCAVSHPHVVAWRVGASRSE